MSDHENDPILSDLEARLHASRPVADDDVLSRSLARAKSAKPRRSLSLVWSSGAPRSTGRKLVAAVAMSAAALTLALGTLSGSGTAKAPTPNAADVQYLDCSNLVDVAAAQNQVIFLLAQLLNPLTDHVLIQAQIDILNIQLAACVH